MIREFSSENREKFSDIIKRMRESELTPLADYVKDAYDATEDSGVNLWTLVDRNNQFASFQSLVSDKLDSVEAKITKIYDNLESVDSSYEINFEQFLSTVESQKLFIDQMATIIDPSQGEFTSERVENDLKPLAEVLKMREIMNTVAQVRFGDKGDYDYEYIRKIMEKNPEEVSAEEYLVLIELFNEMDDEDKAKFIENSYFMEGEPDEETGLVYPVDEAGLPEFYATFELSPVFLEMASRYEDFISHTDIYSSGTLFTPNTEGYDQAMELMRSLSLIKLFSEKYPTVYMDSAVIGDDQIAEFDVRITGKEGFDYTLEINAINENNKAGNSTRTDLSYDDIVTIVDVIMFREFIQNAILNAMENTINVYFMGETINWAALAVEYGIDCGVEYVLGKIDAGFLTVFIDYFTELAENGAELTRDQEGYLKYAEASLKLEYLTILGCGGTVTMDAQGNIDIKNIQIETQTLYDNLIEYIIDTGTVVPGLFDYEAAKNVEMALRYGDKDSCLQNIETYLGYPSSLNPEAIKALEAVLNKGSLDDLSPDLKAFIEFVRNH